MLKNKQTSNPFRGENVILNFEKSGFLNFNEAKISFTYIPDRDIVDQNIFHNWISNTEKTAQNKSTEDVAGQIITHFYNEVLPYYASLDITIKHETGLVQRIQSVKQQPNYKMPIELKECIFKTCAFMFIMFSILLFQPQQAQALEVAVTNANSQVQGTLQVMKNELKAMRNELDAKLADMENRLNTKIDQNYTTLNNRITNVQNSLQSQINASSGVNTIVRSGRSGTTLFPSLTVNCHGGERLVGGGGQCSDGYAYIHKSMPSGNGWYVNCVPRQRINTYVDVYAVCAK